jgi:hypothetical protein
MSIIYDLMAEGTLHAWYDFRSGHANDLSGNGRNGTFTGTPIFTRDGLHFDGTNDALSYGTAFNTLRDMTVGCWVKFGPKAGIMFWLNKYLSLLDAWGFYYSGGTLVLFNDIDNASAVVYTTTLARINEWHRVDAVISTGKEQKLYIDGALVGSGTLVADYWDSFAGSLYVAERNPTVSRTQIDVRDLELVSRELTNTEIVQLMAETRDQRWPQKSVSRARTNPKDHTATPIASNLMEPRGGLLVDVLGEPLNNLTASNMRSARGLLGPGTFTDILSASAMAASYEIVGSLWWSVWFKTGSDVTTTQVIFSRYASATDSWSLRISGGKIAIFDDIDNAGAVRYNTTIRAHEWYNVIVGMLPDRVNQMWINTVAAANDQPSSGDLASFAGGTYVGGDTTGSSPFLGTIFDYEVFADTPKLDDIATRYQAGARAVQLKTDWGVPVTVPASVAAGARLGPFTVDSGTHKIATATIEGRLTKVVECVTAGVVYVDVLKYMGDHEAAFGTWEMWVKKALTADDMDLACIADTIGGLETGAQNGYGFRYANTDDGIYLYEAVAGVLNELGHWIGLTPAGSWYLLHLDREFDGTFNMWIGDNSGVGSAIDLTVTTSRYICFDLDAGDMVALSDVQGNHAFVKKLGAVT